MKPYRARNIRTLRVVVRSETTLSSCAGEHTTRTFKLLPNNRPRADSNVQKQKHTSIREAAQQRKHVFLRPRNPHLHSHRPLLSIRPGLPSVSAHRFREMGAKEEVPI